MSFKKISACFLLTVVTMSSYAESKSAFEPDAEAQKTLGAAGRWSPDCDTIGGITIKENNRIFMEVNSNQIYITSRGKNEAGRINFFLDAPADLGRGGMMLKWDNFSKQRPIAKFEQTSSHSATVEWLGFYDEKSKAGVWLDEPDFVRAEKKEFSKCSD
ncbi:hypothetical protein ACIQVE_28905 [Pseudomonas sp. NPDC098747]|uniref:hypothetical protein n=1 Tax=Pseudomonas sp. NPDC098747 TaxID=3364487 RepID=UPI00383BB4C0